MKVNRLLRPRIMVEPKGVPDPARESEAVLLRHEVMARADTRDRLHSARVALMAAEATLALCCGKLPAYVEDRRTETHAIVRKALAEWPESLP